MNNHVSFQKCSNCGGCYNVCPVNAISVRDSDLFYTPVVDESKCIHCGLCAKICPVENQEKKQNVHCAYGAIHNDEEILRRSSSGGVFSAIAESVLSDGGVVFGAAYTEDFKEVEMRSSQETSLEELRRSKYVESKPGYSFREVKKHLENGTKVLYCGAPCQIAGLKSYLQKEFENLITCDFSCGGMPSHKLYQQWLAGIENKFSAKANEVNFRPKTFGWNNHAVKVCMENGREYNKWAVEDPYFDCFIGTHYSVRDYCLECQFASNHYADIILADLWKYKTISKIENRNKGISLVITNSLKGESIVQELSKRVALTVLDTEKASYNLVRKTYSNDFLTKRKAFLERCRNIGFWKALQGKKRKKAIKLKVKYLIKKLLGRE